MTAVRASAGVTPRRLTAHPNPQTYSVPMHAHLLQYDIVWEDKASNHRLITAMIESAAPMRGDLVVLPEMFDTGFSMNTERTASNPGVSIAFMSQLAERHGVWVLASIPVRQDGLQPPRNCVNRAMITAPTGEGALSTDKCHPFSFGREPERFIGGNDVGVHRVGEGDGAPMLCPIICYDLRFPECFRAGVDQGAECFAVIANWPSARHEHWRALCIARAIENQAIVLGVNRCGDDPGLSYAGGSIAINAMGGVLWEAGGEPCVGRVPLDLGSVRAWREQFPALHDRKQWTLGHI